MSGPNKSLEWFASLLVKNVTKEYKEGKAIAFFPLLAGIGSCRVEYRGQGHCIYMVIQAIHNYYEETKDEDIINGFEEGLRTMIKMSKNRKCVHDALEIIFIQCKEEIDGKAKFEFHKDEILAYFTQNIIASRDEIIKNSPEFPDWYKNTKAVFKEKIGLDLVEVL